MKHMIPVLDPLSAGAEACIGWAACLVVMFGLVQVCAGIHKCRFFLARICIEQDHLSSSFQEVLMTSTPFTR